MRSVDDWLTLYCIVIFVAQDSRVVQIILLSPILLFLFHGCIICHIFLVLCLQLLWWFGWRRSRYLFWDALLQPGLFINFVEGKALLGINCEQSHDYPDGVESQERWNLIISFEDLLVEEGRLGFLKREISTDHCIQGHTARPDVHGKTLIGQGLNHLGCSVAWTTTSSLQ